MYLKFYYKIKNLFTGCKIGYSFTYNITLNYFKTYFGSLNDVRGFLFALYTIILYNSSRFQFVPE